MKLLQIVLSLLLVLTPIACASVHKTSPNKIGNIKYDMEFSEVQKTLGSEGDLVLRWEEKGKNYFVIRYSFGNPRRGYSIFHMIFKDDIYTVGFIQKDNFYQSL